jgi:hypothetical protein
MTHAKGPGQSALLLLDVIRALDIRRIPYAVVGAFAASFYGVIRASLDTDAVISMDRAGAGIDTLRAAFRQGGLTTTYRKGDLRDPIGAVLNVEDRFGNRVDLLIRVRGMEEGVFTRTVATRFMGRTIHLVCVEDFIAMKLFAGSPQDLRDAAGALKVSGTRVDRSLLKRLTQQYGGSALHRFESLLKGPSTGT